MTDDDSDLELEATIAADAAKALLAWRTRLRDDLDALRGQLDQALAKLPAVEGNAARGLARLAAAAGPDVAEAFEALYPQHTKTHPEVLLELARTVASEKSG